MGLLGSILGSAVDKYVDVVESRMDDIDYDNLSDDQKDKYDKFSDGMDQLKDKRDQVRDYYSDN